jgi:hypothetical protein
MRIAIALTLLLTAAGDVDGRLLDSWTYQQLFDKAGLVVIAGATVTRDTPEGAAPSQFPRGLKVMGLATTLRVGGVLKGDHNLREVVVHHYRVVDIPPGLTNGPIVVSFDPSARSQYLLFLTREPDGRYAPVTGQVDPAQCIFKLESEVPPFIDEAD